MNKGESAIKGQSKLRFINTYIWDQPWFIELDDKQKLAYFYMHLKCSDVGIYLHSEKAMKNHVGHAFTLSEIMQWINKKREVVIKLDDDTLFLQWLIKEHSKRGAKVKPISNPDLGKIREAIDSNVLDYLIENDTFHVECKFFEFGISESLVENTSYSAKAKKGSESSAYEKMINHIKGYVNHPEGLHKAFERLIQGLSKSNQNVLIQSPNRNETQLQSQIQNHNVMKDIADGFNFDCVDFLIEEQVKKELDVLRRCIPNVEDWMLQQKKQFIEVNGRGYTWDNFVSFFSKVLQEEN